MYNVLRCVVVVSTVNSQSRQLRVDFFIKDKSAKASRKGVNIFIPKYFMAVRNCINVFVLAGLKAHLC